MGNGKVTSPVKPCPKTFGTVIATVKRTDASKKKGTAGKPLKNVRFSLQETGTTKKSGSSGAAEFSKLPPKTYTVTAALAADQLREFKLDAPSKSVVLPAKGRVTAEFTVDRLATARVHVTGSGANRAGVHVQITGPTTVSLDTNAQGLVDFGPVPIGDYTVQITFTPADANDKAFLVPTTAPTFTLARGDAVTTEVALRARIPLKIKVLRTQPDTLNLHKAHVDLAGPANASADTGPDGTVDFGKLPPGDYTVTVTYVGGDANDLAHYAPAAPSTLTLATDGPAVLHEVPVESKCLTVNVVAKGTNAKLANVGVKVGTATADTDVNGAATCHSLANGANTVTLELRGIDAKNYDLPASPQTVDIARGGTRSITIELEPKKCEVHLALLIKLPDDSAHALPKDLAATLSVSDGTTIACKLNDKGVLVDSAGKVPLVTRMLKFSLLFPAAANTWLVFETPTAPATQELLVDADPKFDSALGLKMAAGSRVILWVQADAKLIEIDGEAAPGAQYAQPNFDFKDELSIGAALTPVKLTIKPKWQYVRFEYFDRKYGKTGHSSKRIGIPPVLVKGSRKTTDGTLQNLAAGSNFTVDDTDRDKSCQALPWIVTKKVADGADLPKLDKTMFFQFGQPSSWILSTSATARTIVKLDASGGDKAKVAPGKDRTKYYDLPKLWTNCFQVTRLPADKLKFFDELTEDEIAGSYDKGKALRFSLDDIVLVDNTGAQTVQDQKKDGTGIALSKYSRVAILHLDPDKKYRTAIWKPRDAAKYHSDILFAKQDGAETYRNVLVDYPLNARAVLFCSGVHHVYDKRTETATFASKHLTGARAAKLDDADISSPKRVFGANADCYLDANFSPVVGGAGFVHKPRQFPMYYLHYGDTDGTTVYGILLTLYAFRFFDNAHRPPTWSLVQWPTAKQPLTPDYDDVRKYQNEGLATAMSRWNGKGYQFEENDDKKDFVIKPFYFFESKDVEDPANTIHEVGGKHNCECGVEHGDNNGSSATDTQMYMRMSGYKDEGHSWGVAPPGDDDPVPDYDGTVAVARCAFAHELGHASIGLLDDYLTSKYPDSQVPTYAKVSDNTASPQRYLGVPYNIDPVTMMSNNRAVRLRTQWGRVLWVNKEANAGGALEKFVGTKVFRAAYEPTGRKKLKYFLRTNNSIYKPAKEAADVDLGDNGKANLYLYELGDDEFTAWMQNGPYDGMVILDWNLCVDFVDHPAPATPWAATTGYTTGNEVKSGAKYYRCTADHTASASFATDAANWKEIVPVTWTALKKRTWVEDLNKHFKKEFEGDPNEGRFKLLSDGTYKKIYVRGFPQWFPKEAVVPPKTHFTIVVKGDGTDSFATAGTTINVANNVKAQPILRYVLGRYTAAPDKNATLALTDFAKVVDWIKGQTGGTDDYKSDAVALTLTAVEPPEGAVEGGDVTLKGNLSDVTSVKFGAVNQPTFTKTSTQITCKVPANAVSAKVKVSTSNRSVESAAPFKVLPAITSVEPSTPAAVGAAVTIHGTTLTAASAVKFGTVDQATFTVVSATQITTTVPASAVKAKITVTTAAGTATSPAELSVIPAPVVADFSPKAGKVGDAITITGTGLDGATAVKIGGVAAAVTSNATGQIVATVGAGAASGAIDVTTPGGTVTKDGYTLTT
jgi:hypothetical protein